MNAKQIGAYGEGAAAAYLEFKNYIILERNYYIRGGEIDIIAKNQDGCTVFVEVKTRRCESYGTPAEYVDERKRQRLIKTALTFTGREDIDMRFDVIEVYYELVNGRIIVTEINHIENAF